jgi:tRNA-Thr(GGU) m(6)t(6)A37 methyltransferase TsaA
MTDELHFIGSVEKVELKEVKIRIYPEFCLGLKGINDFSHIIILYWMHQRVSEPERSILNVTPRRHVNAPDVGVFACRSPTRPNPIGLCVVELLGVDGCVLSVKGLDALEGSPVIDIKPYSPKTDCVSSARFPTWLLQKPLKERLLRFEVSAFIT